VLISGIGLVHGDYGDVINVPEERWHRRHQPAGQRAKASACSIILAQQGGPGAFLAGRWQKPIP